LMTPWSLQCCWIQEVQGKLWWLRGTWRTWRCVRLMYVH